MPRTLTNLEPLNNLLEASNRPIYAVDSRRRIVYCNPSLARWLDLERPQIVGRLVEYHSEPLADAAPRGGVLAPLTDLCPPPQALAGEPSVGTISCVARDGGLAHRRASFVPVSAAMDEEHPQSHGVLAFLSARDLTPQELSADVSAQQSADDLHRTIRQFRRAEAARYSVESLLGESSAMRKVRSQVLAAAASGATTLLRGQPGTGRGQVARAIHYRAAGEANLRLVPVDCEIAGDDTLRRALDAVGNMPGDARLRNTLLLENLDRLAPAQQEQLLHAIRGHTLSARIVATLSRHTPRSVSDAERTAKTTGNDGNTDRTRGVPATIDPALLDAVSTITIDLPGLCERLEDLPLLAQCVLESANRSSSKQVGSLRPDALELLALHAWPGELDELREVVVAAHRASSGHEITPGDLPPVVHHASKSAARAGRRRPERIVLDELLADIEREAVARALLKAGGNKTEAAELLGMTRPRLYRRLVQLGLAGPEFIEHEPNGDSQ